MGIFKREGGRSQARHKSNTERMIVEAGIADCLDGLVEVDVVGETYRQEALERIAGRKEATARSSGSVSRSVVSRTISTTATRSASRSWASTSGTSRGSRPR